MTPHKKEKLLDMQIHLLEPLHFRIDMSDANNMPTLRQFIQINFLITPSTNFKFSMGYAPSLEAYQFRANSEKWKNLKAFLLKHGFTPQDWLMLLPDAPANKFHLDFRLIEKEHLKSLPLIRIMGPNVYGETLEVLKANILEEREDHINMKLSHILRLSPEDVKEILNLQEPIREKMVRFLASIQSRFKDCGLTGKDALFMELNLSNLKTRSGYVNDLIKASTLAGQKITRAKAEKFVDLAKQMGWIKL